MWQLIKNFFGIIFGILAWLIIAMGLKHDNKLIRKREAEKEAKKKEELPPPF